jgi:hypothetical protein
MLQMAPWFGTQRPKVDLCMGEEGGESEGLHPYTLRRDSAGFNLELALMTAIRLTPTENSSIRNPS